MSDLTPIMPADLTALGVQPEGFRLNQELSNAFYGLTVGELLYDGPEVGEVATQWSRDRGIEVFCADMIMTTEEARRLHEQLGRVLESLESVQGMTA
jgi:hypothetical protein